MEGEPTAFGSAYRLLSGAVVPRPIAWVGSRSADGVDNLAPYSFFNVVTPEPPTLVVSTYGRGDDLKDTARNAVDRGAFVVHVVTRAFAEAMNETSATLPPGESEFEHAGLTPAEATEVDAPRIADAPVAFECSLVETTEVGASTLLFGEVQWAHVDEDLLDDAGKFDVRDLDAVGRLSGSYYAATDDRFAMERPP